MPMLWQAVGAHNESSCPMKACAWLEAADGAVSGGDFVWGTEARAGLCATEAWCTAYFVVLLLLILLLHVQTDTSSRAGSNTGPWSTGSTGPQMWRLPLELTAGVDPGGVAPCICLPTMHAESTSSHDDHASTCIRRCFACLIVSAAFWKTPEGSLDTLLMSKGPPAGLRGSPCPRPSLPPWRPCTFRCPCGRGTTHASNVSSLRLAGALQRSTVQTQMPAISE